MNDKTNLDNEYDNWVFGVIVGRITALKDTTLGGYPVRRIVGHFERDRERLMARVRRGQGRKER